MEKVIGIRREDKNQWERRAPLIPEHVKELKEEFGIKTIIQPSKIRIFTDEEYEKAGAEINEDLCQAKAILAVKEIPEHLFEENKTYVFFSHVVKGQSHNMGMLKRMMGKKNNLIDYERVINEKNLRLIFFGRYAGLAGMIETLHAYGQKLKLQGYDTPLEKIKHGHEYDSLKEAIEEIEKIGEKIEKNGLPSELCPLVVGFAGYGNVSRGAQEIFDLLPHKVISANILNEMYESFSGDNFNFYKVVFKEEDMVEPKRGDFDLQDYYAHPEKYLPQFERYIPCLNILVNCIYWTEDYPRLLTKEYLQKKTKSKSNLCLKVIGDISCDIDGAVEITYKPTKPDNPTFTYFADGNDDRFRDGIHRTGITVMAVDNLPCEFSKESSIEFSSILKNFVNDIITTDYNQNVENIKLPYALKKGLILHNGNLTKDYLYINEFLKEED